MSYRNVNNRGACSVTVGMTNHKAKYAVGSLFLTETTFQHAIRLLRRGIFILQAVINMRGASTKLLIKILKLWQN